MNMYFSLKSNTVPTQKLDGNEHCRTEQCIAEYFSRFLRTGHKHLSVIIQYPM